MVRKCADSWIARNPAWQVNLLTANVVEEMRIVPQFYSGLNLTLTALSDVLRIHLLSRYGGVWVDATVWCVRPLDEWLEAVLPHGFFAYAKPHPDRPISSFFLAAAPNHVIVQRLQGAMDRFWLERQGSDFELLDDPNSKNYFWLHSLFQKLLDDDMVFARAWERTPKFSALPLHYLQWFGLAEAVTPDVRAHIRSQVTNIYKLNRRIDLPTPIDGTVVGELFASLCPAPPITGPLTNHLSAD
jgi:hypothetical protein